MTSRPNAPKEEGFPRRTHPFFSDLLPRLQTTAVFLGGAADMTAHELAEEGDIGEIEVVGDLLDAFL